jgi:hypothetical protein
MTVNVGLGFGNLMDIGFNPTAASQGNTGFNPKAMSQQASAPVATTVQSTVAPVPNDQSIRQSLGSNFAMNKPLTSNPKSTQLNPEMAYVVAVSSGGIPKGPQSKVADLLKQLNA